MTGLRCGPDRVFLDLKVQPGASRTLIRGMAQERLRVAVAAAPEDGKANLALREFFARLVDCPKRDVILEKGEKSREKTLSFPLSSSVVLKRIVYGIEGEGKGSPR